MNSLSNIFNEIINDFTKNEYAGQKSLSRKFELNNKIMVLVYYNNYIKTSEVAIKIAEDFDKKVIAKYPNWNGIDVVVDKIEKGTDEGFYLSFQKLADYDDNIYVAILDDLIQNVEMVKNEKQLIIIVGKVLTKWKEFFKLNDELIMTEIKQQGLFSELLFLNKLLDKYGETAIKFWSGCNNETHDFYISGDAVEVKSTSSNSANRASINNEYQLDTNDVTGNLYLAFVVLRKSQTDGETLPSLIQKIIEKIHIDNGLKDFENQLFKYGYLLKKPELYKICFVKREMKYYYIQDDFPKLIKPMLSVGISNVNYSLNLDVCERFAITKATLMEKLKVL